MQETHSLIATAGALIALVSACSSPPNGNGSRGSGLGTGGSYIPPGSGGQAYAGGGGFSGSVTTPGAGTTGFPPLGNGGSYVGGAGTTSAGGSFPNLGGAPAFGGTIGAGGSPMGGGGAPGGGPGAGGGPATGGSGGMIIDPSVGCAGETMPPVTDYGANGPYPSTTINNTGPDGMYTVFRPTTLGASGFKHPIATWGNGITTTPSLYPGLLGAIASHGFVIVASNSTSVTAQLMTTGLDWMIAQNGTAGDYQGKLNPACLVTIGYSLGGGAAVGTGAHKDVVATVSMHGGTGASHALHGPLLLFPSTKDTFGTPSGFVTPPFNLSTVQPSSAPLAGAGDN